MFQPLPLWEPGPNPQKLLGPVCGPAPVSLPGHLTLNLSLSFHPEESTAARHTRPSGQLSDQGRNEVANRTSIQSSGWQERDHKFPTKAWPTFTEHSDQCPGRVLRGGKQPSQGLISPLLKHAPISGSGGSKQHAGSRPADESGELSPEEG